MSATSLLSQPLAREILQSSPGLTIRPVERKLYLFQYISEKIPCSTARLPAMNPSGAFHFNQPFFCRLEASLDKKMKMPLRFRLGSLDYVNSLERKPGF
jgi:hypothetical protein